MADPVTDAGERAAETVEQVVEGAVAQIEAQAEAAEARADAAEAALEVMQDAALRDVLHDEIEEVTEGIEAWRQEHGAVHTSLENRLATLETRCQSLEERLAEAMSKFTVLTVSTPAASEEPEAGPKPAPQISVTTVEPGAASDAAPAVQKDRGANRLRWT